MLPACVTMRHRGTDLALQQRQHRVAVRLAAGCPIARAAHSERIGRSTIHRWLHAASFRQAIESAIADRKWAERELMERLAERAEHGADGDARDGTWAANRAV